MKKVFFGIILGIGAVIPGVCTASLAIVLGVYDYFIEFFSGHLFKKNFVNILLIGTGMIMGMILCSFLLMNLSDFKRNLLTFFFVGLMIAGLSNHRKKLPKFNLYYFCLGFIIIVLFQLVFTYLKIDYHYSLTGLFVLGMLVGIALILPGLSGSLILFSFGAYYLILNNLYFIISNFKISMELIQIIIFVIGIMVGLVVSSVLITILKRYGQQFDNIIYGMMGGTLFIMGSLVMEIIHIQMFIWALLFMILGYEVNKILFKSI